MLTKPFSIAVGCIVLVILQAASDTASQLAIGMHSLTLTMVVMTRDGDTIQ